MNRQSIRQESIRIITEYYQNNYEPFFSAIADHVLWYGPRAGQMLRGKENIISAWKAEENHGLTFSMGSIKAESVSSSPYNMEVMLEYYVYTHFPDGQTDQHHQRLHYSWGAHRNKESQIYMIHISNVPEDSTGTSADIEDSSAHPTGGVENTDGTKKTGIEVGAKHHIYPISPADSHIDAMDPKNRVFFRTALGRASAKGKGQINEITYFFNSSSIRYIQSTDNGTHSVVHTLEGDFTTIERLKYYEKNFPDVLLRFHTTCLVNPMYVKSIQRFKLTLDDGTELPIPEKKYTEYKKNLLAFFKPDMPVPHAPTRPSKKRQTSDDQEE